MSATRNRKSAAPKLSATARYLAAVQQARAALDQVIDEHDGHNCNCTICQDYSGLRLLLMVADTIVSSNSTLADIEAAEAVLAAAG